jgi:nucleotide-binding universal stress UspA family protein
MYKKILVALDATAADQTILEHVTKLALAFDSSLVLLHVADGWAARLFGAEAVSPEIEHDKAYLESIRLRLSAAGIQVEAELTYGEPADQIIRWIEFRGCDLVAMSTHGHRFISDLLYGSTADNVRHHVDVPVLMLKARRTTGDRSQESGVRRRG